MRYVPPIVLSLAFQRSFPRVFDYVQALLRLRRSGESQQLQWPAWCAFPVGVSYDLLRQHYGYERDGVEPYLLSALAGWRIEKRVLRLDAAGFDEATNLPEVNAIPVSSLFSLPWQCLYLEYPSGLDALGSFLFLDYNGEEQKNLFFLLHLAPHHVEPVCLPLTSQHKTLDDIASDFKRCCAQHKGKKDQALFFRKAMALCAVDLGLLGQICNEQIATPRSFLN